MKKTDIKKIYYNGNEITSLYWGGNLIYQKASDVPVYYSKRFAGKFAENSSESNWKCNLNGKEYILPVNPETKDFDFEYEGELTSLDSCFRYSKIKQIDYMPDTSKVSNMSKMFSNCTNLTSFDLSNFNTDNVNSISYMFSDCSNLTSLDLSNFNTDNVNSMYGMFSNCTKLASLDLSNFNTDNVNSIGSMFTSCSSLTSLDLSNFNTNNVNSNMSDMFKYCSSLTSLKLNFNISKVTGLTALSQIFYRCNKLTDITGQFNGIKVNLDLGDCPLTNPSAMVFINGLTEVSAKRNISFKDITYDTLSEEQIALATSKGWSVVRG